MRRFLPWFCWLLAGTSLPARAQDPIVQILPEGADLDPLGTAGLGALRQVTLRTPREVLPDVVEGEVLVAIPGVREVDHDVSVHWQAGLASVAIRHRLTSSARHASEFALRSAVPNGASLRSLEVCVNEICRPAGGAYDDRTAGPSASIELDDGVATLRAGPLGPDATMEVRWAFVAPVPVHAGVARLNLPARGHDIRIAPSRVTFLAEGYEATRVQDVATGTRTLAVEPSQETRLSAHVQASLTTRTYYPCESGTCRRDYQHAATAAAAPAHFTLLLDVSPSTLGPGRGLLSRAVSSLVANAPPGSTFRATAFAGRTHLLLSNPTDRAEVPEDLSAQALGHDLGAATRVDRALASLRPRRNEHLVLFGDGGLSRGEALRVPAGVRVSYVLLDDQPIAPALLELTERTGGLVVRGFEGGAPIGETLAVLNAVRETSGPGAVFSGESIERRGPVRRMGPRSERASPDLAAALRGQNRLAVGGSVGDAVRLDPQTVEGSNNHSPHSDSAPASAREASGLSREPVLMMLRTRVVPAARACFRRDRRGREDYATRAVYHLEFANREVTDVRVEGAIDPALRACLLASVDGIEVPSFHGTVRAHYPLYTVRHGPSATVELIADVEDRLDRAIGTAPIDVDALLPE